jgi:hypothetical protein
MIPTDVSALAAVPLEDLVKEKTEAVVTAMSALITTLLASSSVARFGQASRLCALTQKIQIELVTSAQDATALRAHEQDDYGGYIGAGQPVMPARIGAPYGVAPDIQGMLPNLLEMLNKHFNREEEKAKPKPPTRLDLYDELNAALTAKNALPESNPQREALEKQVDDLIDRLNSDQGKQDADLVPTELLRGHPPRAGFESGDPSGALRPVLEREGRDASAAEGSGEDGALEEGLAVGLALGFSEPRLAHRAVDLAEGPDYAGAEGTR